MYNHSNKLYTASFGPILVKRYLEEKLNTLKMIPSHTQYPYRLWPIRHCSFFNYKSSHKCNAIHPNFHAFFQKHILLDLHPL